MATKVRNSILAVTAGLLLLGTSVSAQRSIRDQPVLPTPPAGTALTDERPTRVDCPGGYGDWSFEVSTSTKWTVYGDAFGKRCPIRSPGLPASAVRTEMELGAGGIGGDYWRDLTYPVGRVKEAWVQSANESIGGLVSDWVDFSADRSVISFLMAGGAAPDIFVSLQTDDKSYEALRKAGGRLLSRPRALVQQRVLLPSGLGGQPQAGPALMTGAYEIGKISNLESTDDLKRYWFDVPSLLGVDLRVLNRVRPKIRLVVADLVAANTPLAHIDADDFRFEARAPSTLRFVRNNVQVDMDLDHPVWGFADTHTHPAANLGFGGQMMLGDPMRPLSVTYDGIECVLHHLTAPGVLVADLHGCRGAPDYVDFPRFNAKLFTAYHPDFLRRAWQGGERLVVALSVSNQYLATRALGTGIRPGTVVDDHQQALLQLEAITKMVQAYPEFMEIAATPGHARRIILQGKMAVVPGVEIDSFGNFKNADFINDGVLVNGSKPLTALPTDPTQRQSAINSAIAQYVSAGARQFTPIHYIDGVFGGTPVMQPEPMWISEAYTNKCYTLGEGQTTGAAVHIDSMKWPSENLANFFMTATDRTIAQNDVFQATCIANHSGDLVSTINTQGLVQPAGRELYLGLMRSGLLIDTEHLSYRTKDDLFGLASFGYPLMSSHTSPLGSAVHPTTLPTNVGHPQFWTHQGDHGRAQVYGSSTPANLSNEFTARDSDFSRIGNSRGTVGVFLTPSRRRTYQGGYLAEFNNGYVTGVVRNDNDGSSKSFAQAYLFAAQKMQGRGVALASDRPGTEQIAPRFGVYSAWMLRNENDAALKFASRRDERFAQSMVNTTINSPFAPQSTMSDVRPNKVDAGVSYDRPFGSYNLHLYDDGDDFLVSGDPAMDKELSLEMDAWKARAYVAAFPNLDPGSDPYNHLPDGAIAHPTEPQKVAPSTVGFVGRVENLVLGWRAETEDALLSPATNAAGLVDRAIFFAARRDASICDLTRIYSTATDQAACRADNEPGGVQAKVAVAKHVLDLWAVMEAGNQGFPIRRLKTDFREWDFNIDGLANYGMLPDFLQDLRNVGVNAPQMGVLFRSAEDYIEMWEKAQAASRLAPAN